ncbi:hypothetical protein PFISCL1PPCAC_25493, partial [Pristionchus fissidentatus]
GVSFGIIFLVVIGIVVFCVVKRRKAKRAVAEKKEEKYEYKMANGLTVLVRNGQEKAVIKGEDFKDMGPLVRNNTKFDVNKEYGLEQPATDKQVEEYFFDKDMNQAYQIGEGVEIVGGENSNSGKNDKLDGFIDDADVEAVTNTNKINDSTK